jgi:hypothetical protein
MTAYQEGFLEGLRMAERLARRDYRVDLAREWGVVPGWQQGRWGVADQLQQGIEQIEAAAQTGA